MAYNPAAFERRQRGISGSYATQSGVNEYARFLAQTRGSRNLGDFDRQVEQQLPGIARSYGKRGLYGAGVKSGIFNKALGLFGAEATRRRQRILEDSAGEERGYKLTEKNLYQDYLDRTLDNDEERAEAIANASTNLLALQ